METFNLKAKEKKKVIVFYEIMRLPPTLIDSLVNGIKGEEEGDEEGEIGKTNIEVDTSLVAKNNPKLDIDNAHNGQL